VVCFVNAENSYFAKVGKKFKGKLSCALEELVATAEKNSWNYYVPLKEKYHINVTACLREPTSAEADSLIDFLTHVQNFPANAEQELFNSWLEMAVSLAFTDESGEKLVTGENAVVIMYK